METIAYAIALIIFSSGFFAMGLYVATQISDWINKKLIK